MGPAKPSSLPEPIFRNALAASSYAGAGKPILLLKRDSIPAPIAESLKNFLFDEIVVVGGPGAVSDQMISQIRQINKKQDDGKSS
ncbi:cell wall-binding repeat-containing protein [Lihuaxuella thermophila]|uniref:cell wall-binding repeat-containing protein n=1 Tax=Lihuaxuella thermophila TaxID=1173111 RepID=UPI000B7CCB35|nr:cell wall-binding repeat-containing protein [Lihuaxuella thermophila]